MFDIIVKDIETGRALAMVKDTFTMPCEGEDLEIDGKHWHVVTSAYEPSLLGLSTDTHIVWVVSTERNEHDIQESNQSS